MLVVKDNGCGAVAEETEELEKQAGAPVGGTETVLLVEAAKVREALLRA